MVSSSVRPFQRRREVLSFSLRLRPDLRVVRKRGQVSAETGLFAQRACWYGQRFRRRRADLARVIRMVPPATVLVGCAAIALFPSRKARDPGSERLSGERDDANRGQGLALGIFHQDS